MQYLNGVFRRTKAGMMTDVPCIGKFIDSFDGTTIEWIDDKFDIRVAPPRVPVESN